MNSLRVNEQVELVKLTLENARHIFNAINTNREKLRPWLPFVDLTRKITDTETFIKHVLHSSCPKKDMIYEIWANHKFAGLVGLKEVDLQHHKTELGYWLIPDKEGKGIMTQACRALIQHAFHVLKMHRIEIKCAVGNVKSIRIPEKLGFTFEGVEREAENLYGKFVNLKVFSLLAHDWKKTPS